MWQVLALLIVGGLDLGPETPYPYLIEGSDNTIFEVVSLPSSQEKIIDGKLFVVGPDIANDGSAKYVGTQYKNEGAERIEIPTTYKEILEMEKSAQADASPWLEDAVHLFLSREALNTLFQKLGENPLDVLTKLGSLSPIKSSVLQKLLFSDNILLSREELEDLSRKHRTPSPVAVSFEIPLTAKGNFNFKDYLRKKFGGESETVRDLIDSLPEAINPLAADVTDWGMDFQRTIQVETLKFVVSERRFILDPADDQILVQMKVDSAIVMGPLLDEGLWSKGFDKEFYSTEKKLVSGEVKGLDLSFRLELKPAEDGEHWVLSLIDHTFVLDFLEDQARVHMLVYGEDEHGELVLRQEPPADLKQAHATVEDKLTEVISRALVTRMFSSSLGAGAQVSEYGSRYETRLSSWGVSEEGISIRLAARVRPGLRGSCLKGLSWEPEPAFELPAFEEPAETSLPWGFFWMRGPSAWFLGERLENPHSPLRIPLSPMKTEEKIDFEDREHYRYWSGPASFRVELSEEWTNWALEQLWLDGQLCISEDDLSRHALNLPEMKIRFRRPPTLLQMNDLNQWELGMELEFWLPENEQQDWGDIIGEEDFHHTFYWSPRISFLPSGKLSIDMPEIESAGLSADTRNAVTEAMMLSLELLMERLNALVSSSHEPIRSITSDLRRLGALRWLEPLEWVYREGWFGLEAFLRQSDLDPLVKDAKERFQKTPIAQIQNLETRFIESPAPIISDSDVRLSWELSDPELRDLVKYELRKAYVPDGASALQGDFGDWSAEQKESFLEVRLNQPGRYIFEVRAISMTDSSVVEQAPYPRVSFYYAPEAEVDGPKPQPPQEPEDQEREFRVEDPNEAGPGEPRRMGAKGAFGCQLQAESSKGFLLWLLVSLFLFMGRRGRRAFLKK